MLNITAIFLGGGIGAVLRYLTGIVISAYLKTNFPAATFFVNIIGCFILGFLFVFFIEKSQINPALKLLLTTGFCGGLTTFSTFSLEIFNMIQDTQYTTAILYIGTSLIIGLLAVFLGGYLCKTFII